MEGCGPSCTHKPSEMQLRFAVGRHDGLTAVDAARRAGYSGDGEQIRGAGSRALKSTSVQELLAYAFAETGTGDDGVIKGPEARRILSRIGRTGDNSARIKALNHFPNSTATNGPIVHRILPRSFRNRPTRLTGFTPGHQISPSTR